MRGTIFPELCGVMASRSKLICATRRRKELYVQDFESGNRLLFLRQVCSKGEIIERLTVDSQGTRVAVVYNTGRLEVRDNERHLSATLSPKTPGIRFSNLAFSADGEYLAAVYSRVCEDGEEIQGWKLWVTRSGCQVCEGETNPQFPIQVIAISADNDQVITVRDGACQGWDWTTGELAWEITYPKKLGVISGACSSCGRYLAVGASQAAYVIDLEDLSRPSHLNLPGNLAFRLLSFSHQGDRLAVAAGLGTIVLWDAKGVDSWLLTQIPGEEIVRALAFSSDDRSLLVVASNGRCPLQTFRISVPASSDALVPLSSKK